MANTSEKLTKLKERYKDKALTRSQRQELIQEIISENYRLDKRPVMSICDYHKRRLFAGITAFVSGAAGVISLTLDIKTGFVTGMFALIFAAVALGLLLWCLIPCVTHKIERSDELSEKNEAMANAYTASAVMGIGLIAVMVISVADLRFTVSGKNVFFLAFAAYGLISAIKSFAVLKLETACPDEDEEVNG